MLCVMYLAVSWSKREVACWGVNWLKHPCSLHNWCPCLTGHSPPSPHRLITNKTPLYNCKSLCSMMRGLTTVGRAGDGGGLKLPRSDHILPQKGNNSLNKQLSGLVNGCRRISEVYVRQLPFKNNIADSFSCFGRLVG